MNVEKSIWSAFRAHSCKVTSIRELSLSLKKSYPLIHQHMTRLLKEGKCSSKQVGRSLLCFPNYDHPYTVLELAHAEVSHLNEQLSSHPNLSSLHAFFQSIQSQGVVSSWTSKDKLIVLIRSKEVESTVRKELSKTAFSQEILYLTPNELSKQVDVLVSRDVVLCGFESFHLQIKYNYRMYASYSHMVVDNE